MPVKIQETMTVRDMRRFILKMRKEAQRLESVANILDRNHQDSIDLYYTRGATRSVKNIVTFIDGAHKVISDMELSTNGATRTNED